MNLKKIGFLVVVLGFVAVSVFASPPREGYYRNSDGNIIHLFGYGDEWYIIHMDSDGNTIGKYASYNVTPSGVGLNIRYRVDGRSYQLVGNGGNPKIWDDYTRSEYTFYQGE